MIINENCNKLAGKKIDNIHSDFLKKLTIVYSEHVGDKDIEMRKSGG